MCTEILFAGITESSLLAISREGTPMPWGIMMVLRRMD